MPDNADLDEILEYLRRFRDERNWGQFHTPKNLALAVSVEAGELLELFQWQAEGQELTDAHRARVADEAADVLIYVLMLFDRLGLEPKQETLRKIQQNEKRFPVAETYGKSGAKDK